MSNSLSGWNERYQQAENYAYYTESGAEIISDRKYNLIMGLCVLYGLAVNAFLCASIGPRFYYSVPPVLFLIGYFICVIAGSIIARKSDNPVISFIGYNLIVLPVGIVVSACVTAYGGLNSYIVLGAFYYTMLITAIMVLAAILFPNLFANLGGILGISLVGILIAGVVSMFVPALGGLYSYVAAAVFALYIGFDYYRAQRCLKTVDNAIDCSIDIYLDIINLFLRIMEILARKSKRN